MPLLLVLGFWCRAKFIPPIFNVWQSQTWGGFFYTHFQRKIKSFVLVFAGTWPKGDITIEFGKPLKILCVLNETFVGSRFPGRNASDLIFIRNNKRVEDEYVRVYNQTAIEFYMQKPPASEDMYYCKLKNNNLDHDKDAHEAVCLNKVVIGCKILASSWMFQSSHVITQFFYFKLTYLFVKQKKKLWHFYFAKNIAERVLRFIKLNIVHMR